MIRVQYSIPHLSYLIFKYERVGAGQLSFWTHDGKVETVKDGQVKDPPYWIRLEDNEEIDDIVKGLIKAGLELNLAGDDSYQQGKIEAMTEHLADMRRLVMDGLPGERE
jgi:hypothetical protein